MIEAEEGNLEEMQTYFKEENEPVQDSGIRPGFSERANDPEILAAAKKSGRAGVGCAAGCILFPFVAVTVGSGITGELSMPLAMAAGAVASVLVLIFYLFYAIHKKVDKSWDGEVVKRYEKRKYEHHRDDDREWTEEYMEYTTVFKKDDGKKKKVKERDGNSKYYDYLKEGDRVRYHPQFIFQYEKYDKSHDKYLYCPVCAARNPSKNDRCQKCNVPLLK